MQRLADQLELQMKEQDVLIAQARDDTNHEKSNNAHLRYGLMLLSCLALEAT